MSSLRIVVTGLIAQHPRLGGVAWDYIQYPLGLSRLGHDVYYLEDSGEWPYTDRSAGSHGSYVAWDPTPNIRHLAAAMERFGLGDRWMYRFGVKPRWYGMPARKRREILASADLLLNVSGTLRRPADYRRIPRLAYIDSDPVFTQVKLNLPRGQLKFQRRVAAHDIHFSFGERLGNEVPETEYRWRPTRQPIVLSEWQPSDRHRDNFTTVMSWTSYPPVRFRGQTYAQKDQELSQFAGLAERVPSARLEVALGSVHHDAWETNGRGEDPAAVLARSGWRIVDAGRACATMGGYRDYLRSSKAEWSVAKSGYVAGQPGWFSCRSACYLAAGRPVVVQDTGLRDVLPTEQGILVFSTPDEAVDAIEDALGSYRKHARAAGEIAREYFDSSRVLSRLVEQAMTASGP
jgi:hypothetical protein